MSESPVGILVCGRDGRIRSASPEVGALLGGEPPQPGALLAEGLAAAPGLAKWIEGALERSGPGRMFQTGVVAEEARLPLRVYVTLLPDGALPDRALPDRVSPDGGSEPAAAVALQRVSGSVEVSPSSVARQTWHDIQNQLGGLKLYATFLKKKLGAADDQVRETADKIVAGIDAVSQTIASARRGEEGTK